MVAASKLKSLVDQHSAGPTASQMGMAPAAAPDDMDDDYDEEPEEAAPLDAAGRGAQLIEEWGEFGTTIKEEATELHDLAHDVGAELLLKDVPDDALKAVGKSVDRMPDELSMGLAKYVSALSPEDCEALATALAKEIGEDKADVKLLCAYLTAAGKYAGEEIDVDEDFNVSEDEEEEETEEGDEEEAPEGGESDPGQAE